MLCKCYEKRTYEMFDPLWGTSTCERGVCMGTKEVEPCKCKGNELNCDFYPEVREEGRKETIEYKIEEAIKLLKDNGYVIYKEV